MSLRYRKRINDVKEPFKMEILDSILARNESSTISLYHIGKEWWDLCAGPHLESTGKIPSNAVELQSIAGAYWRGDETKPQLQRIYGTAWENKEQLEVHKFRIEEAKARDHRLIGKQLNLFSIQNEGGGGLVFWHSKGSMIRRLIEDYWKNQHLQNGYEILYTPHLANLNLWKTSGHNDFYRADMFQPMKVETEEYQLKPMNCPFHCLLYKDIPRSYRDLPLRWAELGTVYRYERSGTLHGLFRVRGFTQDDAHIFCLPEQLENEIIQVLNLVEKILSKFHFTKYNIMLSTRPKDSVGTDEIWDKATTALIHALEKKGWNYSVDEGGGAFYGPKIDIKIMDAIGRQWQCSTIQCDFNLPERFQLEYTPANYGQQSSTPSEGQPTTQTLAKPRPIMIHRAIFGSLERFFGILIENTKGEFPFWLSPIQLKLIPVVDTVIPYCEELQKQIAQLSNHQIRVDIDRTGNRIAKCIKTASEEKIPLIGIIGLQEMEKKTLSLRMRGFGDIGNYSLEKLIPVLLKQNDDGLEWKKESFEAVRIQEEPSLNPFE
jgi:threonyl-tRNA synthetase